MQFDGQDNLEMFMSSTWICLHTNRWTIEIMTYKLFVLANAMQQGAYNRFDLGS